MAEERSDELKARNYAAMLGSVNVIGSVIDDDVPFFKDVDTAGKKARVARSLSYLEHMVALEDWGSEDMTAVNAQINAAKTFIG
jgi:hypothetical protein